MGLQRVPGAAPAGRGRRSALQAALLGGLATTAGCAPLPRVAAVPRGRSGEARVLGVPDERFRIGDPRYEAHAVAALERRTARLGLRPGAPPPPLQLLAVSGGGEDGAFGAGLLVGWTAHGSRPEFDLVTGISTGALTGPFGFLGRDYDDELTEVYTAVSLADIARSRGLLAAVRNDGMADTLPLYNTIARHLDQPMMDAIARAYADGRLLHILTTDLDAQTPVVWNIGAIAQSGHPRALELTRRILLASAAIPGAFPPVMIDVTVDGERRQEMHVDGGAITQAFLYPAAVTAARRQRLARGERVLPGTVYLIRNAKLASTWQETPRRTINIAARSIATMIAASGFQDALRIANRAANDGFAFRLAMIGAEFEAEADGPFDPAYMRALFDHAYHRARRGFDWRETAPGQGSRPGAELAARPAG